MPKTSVNEAPAGPAMDAAVAKVLGLNEFNDWSERWEHIISHNWNEISYSTDIAAAWELWLELTKGDPEGWAIYSREENCVQIEYYGEEWAREYGMGDLMAYGLAPLAICRAFLKANGVEFVEVSG